MGGMSRGAPHGSRIAGNRTADNLVSALLILTVFAATTLLASGFIRSERERQRLLVQYQSERVASNLLLAVAQAASGGEIDTSKLDQLIRAATYDAQGRAELIRIGEAPLSLDPQTLAPGEDRFNYDRQRRSVTLHRRHGGPSHRSGPGQSGRSASRFVPRNEFIMVEMDADGYFRADRQLLLAQIGSPFLIAAVVATVAWLTINNTRYRRRLDAQRQLVQLGEAARTLTHEIRNPLSAIRLRTGLLRRARPPALEPELDVIDDEVRRLAVLADRVNDFIRDPVGQPELVNLADELPALAGRFAALRVESPEGALPVRIDRERLRSVVENLIRNAIDASQDNAGATPATAAAGTTAAAAADAPAGTAAAPDAAGTAAAPAATADASDAPDAATAADAPGAATAADAPAGTAAAADAPDAANTPDTPDTPDAPDAAGTADAADAPAAAAAAADPAGAAAGAEAQRTVVVTAGGTAREVTIRVLDRGRGIAADQRGRVFDPFFTTKSKGSGVGLTISQRFVEAAGGQLELLPRPDGGTESRVTLPRAAEPA